MAPSAPKLKPALPATIDPAAAGAYGAAAYPPERRSLPLVTGIIAIGALYFARDIFIPLALALLLTFALAPLVTRLRRWSIPKPLAVMIVVISAFIGILGFGSVVAGQLGILAENLPSYQYNIEAKIRTIKEAQSGNTIFDKASKMVKRLGAEIGKSDNVTPLPGAPVEASDEPEPMPVKIVDPELQPLEILQTVAGPLIEPIASAGIVIIFVIFMLMRREDLRDRFIRLVGAHDIHRTTLALDDAGQRVGQYLLMQLIVNVSYGIPVGIGLWIIGVPNPVLWGTLAMALRFIPYAGPVIAAVFPLLLSIAVDPGWSMLFWTAALFIVLELVSNNVVEPLLYGSKTGLSPVAILLAAVIWTWLWGTIGLFLATPLTVCLVVLGRHVPQFEFLDVLLGNEPVLQPAEQLYQRLLSGDPDEATERAEQYLEEETITTFYDKVGVAALGLAERDRARDVLEEPRRRRVAESALILVENLSEYEEEDDDDEDEAQEKAEKKSAPVKLAKVTEQKEIEDKPVKTKTVLCAGGHGNLDDAAAFMMADLLEREDIPVRFVFHDTLETPNISKLDLTGIDMIVVGYLNVSSTAHARYLVRRLRRRRAKLPIIIGFWGAEDTEAVDRQKLLASTKSSFVTLTLEETIDLINERR